MFRQTASPHYQGPRLGNPNHFSAAAKLGSAQKSRLAEEDLLKISGTQIKNNNSSASEPAAMRQVVPHQHPEIQIRYSTKQLLSIYKGLGRFSNPLESPETLELEDQVIEDQLRDPETTHILRTLLRIKPCVVLEHLKTDHALPVTSNERISGKILHSLSSQMSRMHTSRS